MKKADEKKEVIVCDKTGCKIIKKSTVNPKRIYLGKRSCGCNK